MDYPKDLEQFKVHQYRSKRLKGYRERMSKDDEHVLVDGNVRDALQAQGFSCEEAPRSIYRVEKLYEALSAYAPSNNHRLDHSEALRSGISLAYKSFARPKEVEPLHILPMTPDTIVKVTSNPSGSAGLTNYGCSKADSMTRALERGLQVMRGTKQPEPCLAFKRTQFNDKTRLVWGYPYSMTVIEGLVAKPLLDNFKKKRTPMAFAITSGALGTRLRVSSYHKEWAYSLDLSQFDATISSDFIDLAFDILETWFDLTEVETVSGLSVQEIFKIIRRYFIHTTIVMPDGNIYIGKSHGVPSGSYFTQMVDSIVNTIMAGWVSFTFNLHVSVKDIFVLGDDLLIWSNRRVSLDRISKAVNSSLHLKLHGSEKSEIVRYDEVIHYLGRDWENGLPSLDESEILKRMVYPESYRKYDDDPKRREAQLHRMLLSYAATYRSAWRIAYSVINPGYRNIHRGCAVTDINTYDANVGLQEKIEAYSGLMRFRKIYVDLGGDDAPTNTALQYWL